MYSTAWQVRADATEPSADKQKPNFTLFLLPPVSLSAVLFYMLCNMLGAVKPWHLPHATTLRWLLVNTNLVAELSSCQYPSSFVQSSATIDRGPESTARPHRNTSQCRPAALLSSSLCTLPVHPPHSFSPAWFLRHRTASCTSGRQQPPTSCRWRLSLWRCWPPLQIRSLNRLRRHASQTWWTDGWAAPIGYQLSMSVLIQPPLVQAGWWESGNSWSGVCQGSLWTQTDNHNTWRGCRSQMEGEKIYQIWFTLPVCCLSVSVFSPLNHWTELLRVMAACLRALAIWKITPQNSHLASSKHKLNCTQRRL